MQSDRPTFQQLIDGVLEWESVKKAFQAQFRDLEASGTPPLNRIGDRTGLTRQSVGANDIIKVIVIKKGEHEYNTFNSSTLTP